MIPILQSAGKTGTSTDAKEQYIASLFTGNVRGAWYDPSDMRTMFQDKYGTIPVTGLNQRVGLILDKSQGLIPGSEQITNNSFEQGTFKWNGGSTYSPSPISNYGSINAGKFDVSFGGPASSESYILYQQGEFNLELNQWYKLEFKIGNYQAGDIGFVIGGSSYFNIPNRVSLSSNTTYTQYIHVTSGFEDAQFTNITITAKTSVNGICAWSLEYVSLKKLPGNHLISEFVGSVDRRPILKGTPNYLEFNQSIMTSIGFTMQTTTETSRKYATISAGIDCSDTLQGNFPGVINIDKVSFGFLPINTDPGAFFQLVVRYGANKNFGYSTIGKLEPPLGVGVNSGNLDLVALGGYKLVWQSVVDFTQTTTAALKVKVNSNALQNSAQLINVSNLNTYFNKYFSLVLGYDSRTNLANGYFNGKIYSLIIVGQVSNNTVLTNILDYINGKMPP